LEEHSTSIFKHEEKAEQELLAACLMQDFFNPEDGGDMFFQNIG
jgi:hypothetical protein